MALYYNFEQKAFLSKNPSLKTLGSFVNAATGGTAIDLHLPGGELYEVNDAKIRAALEAKLAAGCTTVYPVLHWWQGESDATRQSAPTYSAKFKKIYAYYTSIFGDNFTMNIYEINSVLNNYEKIINAFFADFASQNSHVTFIKMPENVTYNNPPLNNHPSNAVLWQLLRNHFENRSAGVFGVPWTGYPIAAGSL